ncbi:MAG: glycosyltransferase family 2 protein [Bacteroidota bacterium]
MKIPQVNIIIPLFNEEHVFEQLVKRLRQLMDESPLSIEVLLVDDGSADATPQLMRQLALADNRFQSIFLSRNFGHQLALSSGLSFVNASEAVMVIDGDLQDPPELLHTFYEYLQKGYDVVYAVRKKRKEGLLKRTAYKSFYRLLKRVSYIDIPLDSGDFSLYSRRVVDCLNQMPEESRFIRGMRSWVGFKQIGVEYERSERQAGESKYSISKLLSLAFNGLFNFSEYPIKFITRLGLFMMSVSMIYLVSVLFKKLIYNSTPEGFTGLLIAIIAFGGMQLLAIGLIGEYVLRIFFQVKQRPLFIVRERIANGNFFPNGQCKRQEQPNEQETVPQSMNKFS